MVPDLGRNPRHRSARPGCQRSPRPPLTTNSARPRARERQRTTSIAGSDRSTASAPHPRSHRAVANQQMAAVHDVQAFHTFGRADHGAAGSEGFENLQPRASSRAVMGSVTTHGSVRNGTTLSTRPVISASRLATHHVHEPRSRSAANEPHTSVHAASTHRRQHLLHSRSAASSFGGYAGVPDRPSSRDGRSSPPGDAADRRHDTPVRQQRLAPRRRRSVAVLAFDLALVRLAADPHHIGTSDDAMLRRPSRRASTRCLRRSRTERMIRRGLHPGQAVARLRCCERRRPRDAPPFSTRAR